jgi:hypothetical protein
MGLEKKIRNALLTASLAVLTGCAYHYIKPTISGESVSFKMKDESKTNYTFPLICSVTKPEGGEPVASGIYTKNPDESYENVLKRCMEDKGFVPGFIADYTSNFPKDAKFYPGKEIRMKKEGEATIPITGYICEIKEWNGEKLESKASTLCITKSYASSASNVVTFPSSTTSTQPAQPQTPSGTVVILPFPEEKSQPAPKQQQQTQMPRPPYQYPQGPTMIINNFYCTPQCQEVPSIPYPPQTPGKPKNPKSQKKSQYTPSYNIPPSTPGNPAEPEEGCEPYECKPHKRPRSGKDKHLW